MTTSFTDKVCAITGAGSGIGREVALELSRRGARVAIDEHEACAVQDRETVDLALVGFARDVLLHAVDDDALQLFLVAA